MRHEFHMYEKSDYLMLCDWWKKWGKQQPPEECFLSDIGAITFLDDDPVAAGFLYTTNSKISVLEFMVTNPSVNASRRAIGIKHLVDFGISLAKAKQSLCVITSVTDARLVNFYKGLGFTKFPGNFTNMVLRWA